MDDLYAKAPTTVIGLPSAGEFVDGVNIHQYYSDTCAIRSQEIILRDFGVEIPQEQLITEASEYGWYQQGEGTSAENVGNLLELHGVGVERYSSATIDDLVKCLAEGKRVIVAVDSGELWEDNLSDMFVEDNHADHALIVAGIDMRDPLHVQVNLTDPGTGHISKSYPIEKFKDAWRDSDNQMIVTEQPAPATAFGMENFDYEAGHIRTIGEMDYNDWVDAHANNFTSPDYTSFDSDGDGVVDSCLRDFDGDGVADQLSVVGNDGSVFELNDDSAALAVDIDGDGQLDTVEPVQDDYHSDDSH